MTESQPPSGGTPSSPQRSAQRPSAVLPVEVAELAVSIGLVPDAGAGRVEVTGISLDSRTVQPGDLYLALPGERVHGASFAAAAIAAGAAAVVTDEEGAQLLAAVPPVPVLVVENPRSVAGGLAQRIYRHSPVELFGLTGTNGKTTTSYLIRSLLAALGRGSGLIGTIETLAGDTAVPATLTTPEATDVHALIALMAEKSLDAVVMEVSSHALAFGRVDGLVFDVAGFTNLTQDHLDLHGTMEAYAATKSRLFSKAHSRTAVVTVDDAWGRWIADAAEVPVLTLQTEPAEAGPADWRVESAVPQGLGWQIELRADAAQGEDRSFRFRTSLPGRFNIANAALAVLMVFASGVPAEQLQRALDEQDPLSIDVPGRMQLIGREPVAVVDFAHNPDALQRAMDAVRPNRPGRLITVFGATGQRDQGKRPIMGALAARGSDVVIVTDDDPHDEDASQIREQVLAGALEAVATDAPDTLLETVAPRAAAIERAVAMAGRADTILIAGRGHEHWQEVRGVNLALDDRQELREALLRHGFTPEPVPGIES
ncbi:UDP-N-acetylmuramoyl-L-alanyl-D-glutamate--2,6-diaminopimelate ligase [Arthrobacter russicus]|uniref:UDP-N-acetylmuramyl-tripeptide synthetase n=1 Tax=Arthrobacter russicus TaxID=172040 RepID=A0ABU1JG15_9MICC|nr:UDP-N-acetylmuramoyl-L-alanyl-D-glutamate--2,6-diaminopimelate ligase [Arthrobacter russicus]MDR6271090.1 UDP-N-acetylmuramoyl-L-alanyl-D-glutamate--2,6-diaminopimelate ligase [Arthrobacter russicus]